MNLVPQNSLNKTDLLDRSVNFSVIIPTFNRDDLLSQCLDCIIEGMQSGMSMNRSSSEKKVIYEIIVTDDSQTPKTKIFLQDNYPEVRHVYGPGKGPASNRNRGASFAKGNWLVFTDDDCIPCKDWLTSYCKSIMDSKNIRAFEGSIHPKGNLDKDLAECPENKTGGNFWSANICIQKTLFDEINGFDESYKIAGNEDQDIKIRLEQKTKIEFISDAKVHHPVRVQTLRSSLKHLPDVIDSWTYHVSKNGKYLGINNRKEAVIESLYFNIRAIYFHLIDFHYKSVIVNLVIILWGLPNLYLRLKNKL